MGTRGEEGQWLEPPRGNSSAEVLERFDEIAENSPEGVSIFVVKPGLSAPESAPALVKKN